MEEWKDIEGYEGLYQVSSEGRVRSLKHGIIMSLGNCTKGYKLAHLYKGGFGKTYRVHRLVANAFIPNPDNLPEVNHKDEDKTNNKVENLEWCTTEYNIRYGNRTKKSSKTVYQFTIDNIFIRKYDSASDAARLNNFSSIGNIASCCLGLKKTYKGYKWSYEPL